MKKWALVLGIIVLVFGTSWYMTPAKPGVPVLMYHMVSDWTPPRALAVQVKEFERQIQYLSEKGYTVMSLEEMLDALSSGEALPKKTVVITFDDGYEDNYINAFPILKKYNYPATVFMPSDLVGKTNEWDTKIGYKETTLLNSSQIKEMSQNNISFQSHTSNHVRLTEVSKEEARKEIFVSKDKLAQITGQKVDILCYPYGEFSEEIESYTKDAGYRYAITTVQGRVLKDFSPYAIKRVRVLGTYSLPQFIYVLERSD